MSKIYVTPHINDWAVRQEGMESMVSVHRTKKEAVEAAKEVAIGRDVELVILKKDGTIDNPDDYPTDSFSKEK